ncbi:dehydratase [Lithospermum erythrorhizon]|uniref:Carbonic anhydrase n=1 Tax=Lithospermum erythrorhizon TaxID=34254 RepID=A0AAV3NL06_LITER
MEKIGMSLYLSCCFIILVLLHFACIGRAQEVENEREFSYNHSSRVGPAHWGRIRPEWRICNNGTMQSPIDMLHQRVQVLPNLGIIRRDYRPANATLLNRGHDMMLRFEGGAGNMYINGTAYLLRQCHWHSPSEHTVNGKRFDMEIHLVHQSATGKIAVIGAFYHLGANDSFLLRMTPYLRALANTTAIERPVGMMDPRNIQIGSGTYYRYVGSLTVPPCTQFVDWSIVRSVRSVADSQVNLIRQAVQDSSDTNARPLQPINQRTVNLFAPMNNRPQS